MEEVFKKTAKRAPVITAVLVFVLAIGNKFLEKEMPYWGWIIFIVGCFVLTYLVIFFNYYKKNKDKVNISNQKITDVNTDGGNFIVGSQGKASTKVVIKGTEIKGVKTGGGNFTVGKNE